MANRSVSAGKASFLDKAFLLGLGKPKSRLQVQSVDDTSKLSSFATQCLSEGNFGIVFHETFLLFSSTTTKLSNYSSNFNCSNN